MSKKISFAEWMKYVDKKILTFTDDEISSHDDLPSIGYLSLYENNKLPIDGAIEALVNISYENDNVSFSNY